MIPRDEAKIGMEKCQKAVKESQAMLYTSGSLKIKIKEDILAPRLRQLYSLKNP